VQIFKRLGVGSAVLLFATLCLSESGRDHFSTLQGAAIRIEPVAASLQVPQDWVLYLTKQEIKSVKKGEGEWQTEYAKVLNAALPFAACSLHAGKYRWESPAVGSLQMRVYVLDGTVEQVQKGISSKGFSAAKSLSSKHIHNAAIAVDEVGPWRRVIITYDAWYGDYGGKANLNFYASDHGPWTVAVVFLGGAGAENSLAVAKILHSFSWVD
jgi:hypothetical protein